MEVTGKNAAQYHNRTATGAALENRLSIFMLMALVFVVYTSITVDPTDISIPHGKHTALVEISGVIEDDGEVDAEDDEEEGLQQRTTGVHRVAHLAQGAEKPAGDEDDGEQQHALVEPAGHAAPQTGRARVSASFSQVQAESRW